MKAKDFLLRFILVMLVFQIPLFGSLRNPTFGSILIDRDNRLFVHYYRGNKILVFDSDRNFLREISLSENLTRFPSFMDNYGRLWLKGQGVKVCPTSDKPAKEQRDEISILDRNLRIERQVLFPQGWDFFVAPEGNLYGLEVSKEKATVFVYNFNKKDFDPLFNIPKKDDQPGILSIWTASRCDFIVNSSQETFVLLACGGIGTVYKYDSKGNLLKGWEVKAEPMTSVSFIKEIELGMDNHIYVTHSSWEASSARTNEGSIIKFDADGNMIFRIKDEIGYLIDIAVDRQGNVYVSQLDDEILKYSSSGQFLCSWNAVPPEQGLSWPEKRELEEKMGHLHQDSPLEELAYGLVHGDGDEKEEATNILKKRSQEALPFLMNSLEKYAYNYRLVSFIENTVSQSPNDWQEFITKEFFRGNNQLQENLAPLIANYLNGEIKNEALKILNRLVREGKGNQRFTAIILYDHPLEKETIFYYLDSLISENSDKRWNAEFDIRAQIRKFLPYLIDIINDPNDKRREAARHQIINGEYLRQVETERTQAEEALEALRKLKDSKDAYVRNTCRMALAFHGEGISEDDLIDIAEEDPNLRPDAFKLFEQAFIRDNSLIPRYFPKIGGLILEEKDSKEQDDLIKIFALSKKPQVLKSVFSLTKDPRLDSDIKDSIFFFLADMPGSMEDQERFSLLYKPLPVWRKGKIISGIAKLKVKRGDEALFTYYSSASQEEKPLILENLGSFGNKKYAKFFNHILSTEKDRTLIKGALMGLAKLGSSEETESSLLKFLNDPEWGLFAAVALAKNGKIEALPILMEGLKRLGFYTSLSEWLRPEVFLPFGPKNDELVGLLDYDNYDTISYTAYLLGHLKVRKGIPRVQKLFQELIEGRNSFRYSFHLIFGGLLYYGLDPYKIILENDYQRFCERLNLEIRYLEEENIKKTALRFLKSHLSKIKEPEKLKCVIGWLGMTGHPEAKKILRDYRKIASEKLIPYIEKAIKGMDELEKN